MPPSTHEVIQSSPHKSSGFKPPSPLLKLFILRKLLLLTDGRDKVMKVAQYGLKTALWLQLLDVKRNTQLHGYANKTISHFSMTRKIIRLLYWLNSLEELVDLAKEPSCGLKPSMTPVETLRQCLAVLNASVGVVNGWVDDIVVAGKMGLVEKPLYNRATIVADRLWYFTIFIDVHENLHGMYDIQRKMALTRKIEDPAARMQYRELEKKLSMQRLSLVKLMADFTFCSVDVLNLGSRQISDGWQNLSGLLSAILGTYKLWTKHR
ncbi:peroxisomal biogenesis factor 11 [Phlyctochytrium arcticum]|nr:peroxisomal biogenesis factor 11 [Phlyctochytrium arcticum]